MLYQILIVLLLLVAIAMISLILVQQGKGAGMGASFGAGASNTVFGSVGSGNFLTKSTWFLILLFFALCLGIGYLQKIEHEGPSATSGISKVLESTESVPAVTTDAPTVDLETVKTDTDVPAVESAASADKESDAKTEQKAPDNTDAPKVE